MFRPSRAPLKHSLQDDLDLAAGAALAAGAEVRARFGDAGEVRYKSAAQPVTEADLAADAILRERLHGARPGYGWLSEETADSGIRLERERVWVVDPIDGTNSFVAEIPEFVVSIGLVVEGITTVAVVYNPVTEEMYRAVQGGGAWLGDAAIHVAAPPPEGQMPLMLGSRWEVEHGRLEGYAAEWRLTTMGSTAYRMVKVAEGVAHAFVSPARKNEWDVCAAALVVEEAGGRVADGHGAPLRFNRPAPVLHGIMAWGTPDRPRPPLPPR